MTTTADGYLTVEGDRLSVGVPHAAHLPLGFVLVFVVCPAMTLVGLVLASWVPTGSVLAAFALSASLVAVPGAIGMVQLLRSARSGRRREVHIDLGEWLLTPAGKEARVLRRPDRVRVSRRGLGWRLSMDEEPLLRAPFFAGRSVAAAASRLAEAMECELDVPASARRARLPFPRKPGVLAALAYLPFEPVAVPLSLWILATSTHAKARFAAIQSLVLEVLEVGLLSVVTSVLAVPLLLLSAPTPVVLAVLLCPLAVLALLRVMIRGALALRAARGVVMVVFGLGWLVGRWSPTGPAARARQTAPRAPARPRTPRPVPAPRTPAPRSGAGGLGPWWT